MTLFINLVQSISLTNAAYNHHLYNICSLEIEEAKKLKEAYVESAQKFDIQINYSMLRSIVNAKESIHISFLPNLNSFLDHDDKLLSLNFSHQNLHNDDLYPLLDALKKIKSVYELNFSHNTITVHILSEILS